jgi:hypothetical protein
LGGAGVRRSLGRHDRKHVELEFINPRGLPITYTPRILAGPGGR